MRIVIALAVTICAAAGFAAEPVQPAKPVKDSRVCRDAAATGSHIRSSECHLRSEWVEIDAARRKQYEELNRAANGGAAAERAPTARPYP